MSKVRCIIVEDEPLAVKILSDSGRTEATYKSKFEAAKEILKEAALIDAINTHSIPIRVIYVSPNSKKLSQCLEQSKDTEVILIDFDKLKEFKSKNYPDEWNLFSKYFLSFSETVGTTIVEQ